MDGIHGLHIDNVSSSSVKLPDGLELNFQDSKGLTYGAQFVASVGIIAARSNLLM